MVAEDSTKVNSQPRLVFGLSSKVIKVKNNAKIFALKPPQYTYNYCCIKIDIAEDTQLNSFQLFKKNIFFFDKKMTS